MKFLRRRLNIARKLGIENNKVKYLDYLSGEDRIGLIDAAKPLALPSKYAGGSYLLVIDEVKARGKLLIITNHGSLPYRVKI